MKGTAAWLRFAAAVFAVLCNSCTIARIVYFNTPTLAAPTYFDNVPVHASAAPSPLPRSARDATFPLTDVERAKYGTFEHLLERNRTRAFLAIHDDTIVYERYFEGITEKTRLPSFSMSKTFAAVLIGCALGDGLVESLDDPVIKYIPELASKEHYDAVTLDELLRMTAGIDFNEESIAGAALYYSTDLRSRMYSYDVKWPPGEHYLYGSVSIQLLWDVLHRRLGGQTVSHYFEERIWAPLGAEEDAAWSLDSRTNGVEKMFSGFSATARDHARLGLLFLHGGSASGRPIVPRDWVERSLSPDPIAGAIHTSDGIVRRGKYQWFLTLDGRNFFAKGYHGQYVFVVPAKRAVFVRFGEGYGDLAWTSVFERFAASL